MSQQQSVEVELQQEEVVNPQQEGEQLQRLSVVSVDSISQIVKDAIGGIKDYVDGHFHCCGRDI